MYADDTVNIAETLVGLQNILDTLYNYSRDWDLNVNVMKTKIVIFRNGGKDLETKN
jgi:hypothetical protein